MEIIIRPPVIGDAKDINSIRRMDGVRENTLGLASETLGRTEDFIQGLGRHSHMFVAEVDGHIAGVASLMHSEHPRMNHSGSIGISVHSKYQRQGVGTKLMEALLDISDNWLMLTRVELGVLVGNDGARKLYERLGFEEEGVRKMAIIRNGKYTDEIMMARIKVPEQFKSTINDHVF